MKFRLLSLLSVVLVLSIKAYETTAHELNKDRSVSIYQPDLGFTNDQLLNPVSTIDSLVLIISESNVVKEAQVGLSGATPKEYEAFQHLKEVATKDELNGLLTHYAPSVRVYAYRALVANEMEIEATYQEALLKDTTEVDWFSGCILMPSSVQELVSHNFVD